jgi:hypothetical protein
LGMADSLIVDPQAWLRGSGIAASCTRRVVARTTQFSELKLVQQQYVFKLDIIVLLSGYEVGQRILTNEHAWSIYPKIPRGHSRMTAEKRSQRQVTRMALEA